MVDRVAGIVGARDHHGKPASQNIAVASPHRRARIAAVADHDVTWRLLFVGPMPDSTAAA